MWIGSGPSAAQDLAEVRAERARLQERLDAAAERLGELEAEAAEIADERAVLEGQLGALQAEADRAQERISSRVRSLYMRGDQHPMLAMLGGSDPQEAVQRAALMERLVDGDRRDTEAAVVARVQVAAVADRIADREAALARTFEEQQTVLDGLEADLQRAQALEAKLVAEERARRAAEEARRRAAEQARRAAEQTRRAAESSARSAPSGSAPSGSGSAPVATGGKACPVGRPHSFTDTWGAPRSGGRRHQGTDILAPRGQDVLAIVSGTWDVRSYGASAGNWGILRGSDGHAYYYMHLERHIAGDGQKVSAGQLIATNGDTGNARGTTPHVHFEYHPGGGGAVNPYPLLKQLCG